MAKRIARLIFPNQLFEKPPSLSATDEIYLIEEHLFFSQFLFHRQKLAYHRATMKTYQGYLEANGHKVNYVESSDECSDLRNLVPHLAKLGFHNIVVVNPEDDWIERGLSLRAADLNLELSLLDSPMFLNTREQLAKFFTPKGKKFFQTKWYKQERKRLNILIEDDDSPAGGSWTYDKDNRLKYPSGKAPPKIEFPAATEETREAVDYVNENFPNNPGKLSEVLYPVSFDSSRKWLKDFLKQRFDEFGPYEDALVTNQQFLNHSLLTPMLNAGLLTPAEVVEEALDYALKHGVRINSTEGFIRQIIGWREFIRGIYVAKGREERTRNFWDFKRKIPASFYDGNTGIFPIDNAIGKVLATGYCHHIERLMVLGNFMVLCEFDPGEVYRWFMELFIDAYDWVMVPNVYGMSQYADGGLMSTKPYISGSNYLMKMSDYPKGDWQNIWDALYWRFIYRHREFFLKNPRMAMIARTFDKFKPEKRDHLLTVSENYLSGLDRAEATS